MASLIDITPLANQFLDRRVKLLDCQKEQMKRLYDKHGKCIKDLAAIFHVSRRLVQFVLFPERYADSQAWARAKGGSMRYYDKTKATKATFNHRQYKKQIANSLKT